MRYLLLASATAAAAMTGLGTPVFAQGPGVPGGSYLQTCRNVQASGGQVSAECLDTRGRWQRSTLVYGGCRAGVTNQNGVLLCDGPPPPPPPREDRRDDRAAAAIAGAVAGALLGPPPVYGEERYGDPRFDPHYAQGGWGYGHRQGEWVSIRDRADWLDMRIDRAQRDGRLSREDARDLRRQLNAIEDREADFVRQGRFGPSERADLDRRFDELSNRISYDSGPPEPRDGDDRRGRDDFRR